MAWDQSVAETVALLLLMLIMLALSPSMITASFVGYAIGAIVYSAINARHDREMEKIIDRYRLIIRQYQSELYGEQK